jgi:hypothetical protein
MKILTATHRGNRLLMEVISLSFLALLITLITSCTGKQKNYSIIEFTGDGGVMNYSKSFYLYSQNSDSANPTALIVGAGDLITYGDDRLFYCRETTQNRFSFKTIKNVDFINGKISTVNIPGNEDMIPWFKQMKNTDISALEFLNFKSKILDKYIPYLTELSKSKPSIGLGYSGELKDMEGLFRIFNPGFIIGVTLSTKDFKYLSGLTNLEFLLVNLNDSLYRDPLPPMPRLKQLIIGDSKNAFNEDADFLINNKQIEKLIIVTSGRFNFSVINPLDNLKELIVSGFDSVENFDQIKSHKSLEVLSITGEKIRYDSTLNELPDIHWMAFSPNTSQKEFNQFIKFHPDLEVVEILKNKEISSLRPLLQLKRFYGLTITDTLTDIATIKLLRNLKYLSLPKVVLNDSLIKAGLQKSLPDTRIVANQGFCLGSGWLLLIIPLILLFRVFENHKSGMFRNRI